MEDTNRFLLIQSMLNDGYSRKEIATNLNISVSTVNRLLRERGIISRIKLDDIDVQNIIYKYNNGCSILSIAEQYHKSEKTISDLLKKNGIHVLVPEEMNHKYKLDARYFDNINTEDKAYFLGLIAADGCVTQDNKFSISLQEQDKYIIELFQTFISSNHPIKYIDYKSKGKNYSNQYCLCFSNKHMCCSLKQYGIIPNKSIYGYFPQVMIDSPFLRHFIRGYLDGDGCISKSEKRIRLIGTYDFCNVLQ